MNAHVISVSDLLRMLFLSVKIDFSISTCRFNKYKFVSQTILAIVKARRLFSTESTFYVCMYVI